jgi:ubiquinone biosynthesis protein
MPALRNAGKNLVRLREISSIVARHGFGQFLDRERLFEAIGIHPKETVPEPEKKLSMAERFRLMLIELGPTFVKLGQVLSSRPDILPPDFVRELSRLQDDVPALPIEHVYQSIESGLGRTVNELYSWLDEAPLASASIAQVHRARTMEGEDVIVKVQRPGISERIRADLDLLYYLASFLERVVEETGIYTPKGIVEEFEKSLKSELDFLNEANNVRQFYKNHQDRPYVVIPKVYDELTCRTVLTLQRLHGRKITEIDETAFDRKEVAHNLIQSLFEQLFVDGLFHGDPHPGNVFVLEGNRIGLVDFGLVGRMTKQMQETIIVLCLAVALKDPDTVARLLYRVGVPDDRVNLGALRTDVSEILDRYLGGELRDVKSEALIQDLIELALKYRIKVPKDYALLTKAAITIEGLIRKLYPEMDVLSMAMPYAKRLLFDRINPRSASGGALRTLLQAQTLVTEMPLQVSQILLDLEGGKFAVNVKSEELPQLVGVVRWLGMVVFTGLISSALIIGSFFMLAQHPLEVWGIPLIPVLGLLSAAAMFGGAFAWTFLSGRMHKISLRRWFSRS